MSTSEIEHLRDQIFTKIDGLSAKIDGYQLENAQRITQLETKTDPLFDNGQMGVINKHADRLSKLENKDSWRDGKTVGISAIISIIVVFIPYLYKVLFK